MSTTVNAELLQELLEFDPVRANGRKIDLADPPRSDDGELICGRRRSDREACTSPVKIPFVCCNRHDPADPIA